MEGRKGPEGSGASRQATKMPTEQWAAGLWRAQATDHAYAALDADRATQLLLGACIDRSGSECVGLYSLDVESMLVGRGREK